MKINNVSSSYNNNQVPFKGLIPDEFIKISESGISDPQTVIDLQAAGYRGFLMGENFMKTTDPGKALDEFIKQLG